MGRGLGIYARAGLAYSAPGLSRARIEKAWLRGLRASACPLTHVYCYSRKRGCYVSLMEEHVVHSSVRGHHIYKDIWTPAFGEVLTCTQELTNVHDIYAVAMKRGANIVGHVPRSISYLCYLFIESGGNIQCEITGQRKYSADLPQGGLEVPCKLKFQGSPLSINKVKKLLPDAPSPKIPESDSITPSKKMKIDLNVEPTGVWLSLEVLNEVISLSHTDRRDLCNPDTMLNDNHINFAQNY